MEFGEDKALKLSAPELRSRFKMNLKYEEFGITEQWVTTVTGDRCVFWNEGCRIHNSKAFPKSCRLYPWQGRDHSLQMPADAYVCPELGLPEPPYARAPIED